MKNLDRVFLIAGVISFSFLTAISSCESISKYGSKPSGAVVNFRLKENRWKISYYLNEHDETHLFRGYTFKFANRGLVTATNVGSSVGGSWSIVGQNNDHVKLNFDFTLRDRLDELNSEWIIADSNDQEVVLEKADGVSKDPDRITFSRI